MSKSDYSRILDYFTRIPDIPDDLRRDFGLWLMEHADDPDLDGLLLKMWNENAHDRTAEDNAGFMRVLGRIRRPRRRNALRTIGITLAVAAGLALFFIGGYFLATLRTPEPEPVRLTTLLTSPDNTGDFTLPDGTRVRLNRDSRLTYNSDFTGPVREAVLEGEAYFNVTRDTLRPFRLEMDEVTLEVLGTSFDAINNASSSKCSVILESGSVSLTSDIMPEPVLLVPGDKADIYRSSGRSIVRQVDTRNYCSWFAPRLTFDNCTLSDILTNLERRYNIEITVTGRIPLDSRLSLTVAGESIGEIMDVLSALLPITYTLEGDRMTIN